MQHNGKYAGIVGRVTQEVLFRKEWRKQNPCHKLTESELLAIEQETVARHNR